MYVFWIHRIASDHFGSVFATRLPRSVPWASPLSLLPGTVVLAATATVLMAVGSRLPFLQVYVVRIPSRIVLC
jgi:hypothetical protein